MFGCYSPPVRRSMLRRSTDNARVLSVLAGAMGAAALVVPQLAVAQSERLGVPLLPIPLIGGTTINQPGLSVTPSGEVAYDDNIFRTDDDRTAPVDDIIVTPAVRASYQRQVGHNDLRVDGDFAYSFYTRNTDRSRARANVQGTGTIRVAGICQIQPDLRFTRQQADYGDINGPIDNFQTFSTLAVKASCPRAVGFFPLAELSRRTTRNDAQFDFADQTLVSAAGGIGYARPSLGQAALFYRYSRADRPTIGVVNRIDEAGVTFNRAVVSRVELSVDLHYLQARSQGANVRPYHGAGWDLDLVFRPIPRIMFKGEAGRRIVNDSLVPAGFTVQSDYALSTEWRFAERTTLRGGAVLGRRSFRGDPLVIAAPFSSDRFSSLTLGLTRAMGERLYLTVDGQRTSRRTNTGLNNYDANRVAAGVSYRF